MSLKSKKQITVPNVGDKLTLNCGYGGGPDETLCRIESLGKCSRLFGEGYTLTANVRIPGTGERFSTDLVN